MTLKTKVTHDLDREPQYAQQTDRWLRAEAWRIVRIVSFNLERVIKFLMPILTGRARGSWGRWTPADVHPGAPTSGLDAHWEENERDLSIDQGSNLVYVPKLNKGYSSQAPEGFIDDAHEKHQEQLDRLTDGIVDELVRRM